MSEGHFDPQLMELFQAIAEKVLDEDAQRAAAHHRELVGQGARHVLISGDKTWTLSN